MRIGMILLLPLLLLGAPARSKGKAPAPNKTDKQAIPISRIRNKLGKEDTIIHHEKYSVHLFKVSPEHAQVARVVGDSATAIIQMPQWTFTSQFNTDELKERVVTDVVNMSQAMRHYGFTEDGIKLQEGYVVSNPDSTMGYLYYALTLIWEDRVDEGLQVFRERGESVTDSMEVQFFKMNYMPLLIESGNLQKAIDYAKGTLVDPQHIDIHSMNYNLACAYSLNNNLEEAIACIKIVAKDPDTEPNKYHSQANFARDSDFDNIRKTKEFRNVMKLFPKE